MAKTLLECSTAIIAAGPRAEEAWRAGDDVMARDLASAHSHAVAEAVGVDWDELHDLAMMFAKEVHDQIEESLPVVGARVAIDTAVYSAVVAAVLVAGSALSGVDPPGEVEPFTEHPEIANGGWICGHGEMVTVVGIDAGGAVAYMHDGALIRHDRRPSPEAFLGHYTRIDDVPVLGGEAS